MSNTIPVRKQHRLRNYDYSLPGSYYITVCVKDRKKIFWEDFDQKIEEPEDVMLSPCGEIVKKAIGNIPNIYSSVTIDAYTIMPDHVHMLLQIHANEYGVPMQTASVLQILAHFKAYVSKQIGCSIWQKASYDHILRATEDYEKTIEYIYENPIRWANKIKKHE